MSQFDNETNQIWREVHEDQAKARAARKVKNLEVLAASTIPYETRNDGDVVLIRARGYPIVDFWPSTNKWATSGRYMMGNAESLIAWLKKKAFGITEARKP